ncbi:MULTISPECIES: DUF805 domain-containing protein [Bacillaceae]|uniref:DUF805 domain-containing protein n=1 Tax=Bacillaceae TaxID=186817 RepID=UPI000BED76EF|nr:MULTISPECIES: DUF805 domain-containing protein [unclassified Bacillus (in: firmicutes)]PEC51920.1 hypothetical protein CON00_00585 [Bacillus sp. AFS096315]PFM78997.1 hypothetical protein COJ46_15840 [Bacillus sp. AFS077874]
MQWYLKVLKNYVVFHGRASRTEFWMFMLINAIITFLLSLLDNFANTDNMISGIYGLLTLLPLIAVGVRRLHDIGKSGWWYLISLIPFIGSIILLILACFKSENHENRFGPVPR